MKKTCIFGTLARIIGVVLIGAMAFGLASCDNGTGGGKPSTPPEQLPPAERWGSWVDTTSTATLEYSVDSNDVCTIIISGTADVDRWKANVGYSYTEYANTLYAYEFEAWTESGEREVNFQYYWDDNTQVGLSKNITITTEQKTYTIKGIMPKGGVRYLEFQCADQLGTFHVKIISIERSTPSLEYELIDEYDEYGNYNDNHGTYRLVSASGMSGPVTIPATYNGTAVTEIGGEAFRDTSITSVIIPSSVNYIGMWAFGGCTNINSITIPASVQHIEMWAFNGWTASQKINIAGHANRQSTIDFGWAEKNEWEEWSNAWDEGCNASIVYQGQLPPTETAP